MLRMNDFHSLPVPKIVTMIHEGNEDEMQLLHMPFIEKKFYRKPMSFSEKKSGSGNALYLPMYIFFKIQNPSLCELAFICCLTHSQI